MRSKKERNCQTKTRGGASTDSVNSNAKRRRKNQAEREDRSSISLCISGNDVNDGCIKERPSREMESLVPPLTGDTTRIVFSTALCTVAEMSFTCNSFFDNLIQHSAALSPFQSVGSNQILHQTSSHLLIAMCNASPSFSKPICFQSVHLLVSAVSFCFNVSMWACACACV